jgi:proteasome assembly chaperone (PAC2) family protein
MISDSKDANAIIYACNATLAAIRIDEQEKRIDELEQIIEKIKR